jgi:hypothetical protein
MGESSASNIALGIKVQDNSPISLSQACLDLPPENLRRPTAEESDIQRINRLMGESIERYRAALTIGNTRERYERYFGFCLGASSISVAFGGPLLPAFGLAVIGSVCGIKSLNLRSESRNLERQSEEIFNEALRGAVA